MKQKSRNIIVPYRYYAQGSGFKPVCLRIKKKHKLAPLSYNTYKIIDAIQITFQIKNIYNGIKI